jgi:hypothetical protein
MNAAPESRFSRAWVDAFGSAYTILEGGTGNRVVLVVCKLESARAVLEALSRVEAFKGRIVLAVVACMHEAPLLEVLRQTAPTGVIAVEDVDGIASSGAETKGDTGAFTASTGLNYLESGAIPAWCSGIVVENALEVSSLAASLASERRIPALVCGIEQLESALNRFWARRG